MTTSQPRVDGPLGLARRPGPRPDIDGVITDRITIFQGGEGVITRQDSDVTLRFEVDDFNLFCSPAAPHRLDLEELDETTWFQVPRDQKGRQGSLFTIKADES